MVSQAFSVLVKGSSCMCPKEKARQILLWLLSPNLRSNTGSLLLFSILQKQVTKADPGPRGGELEPNIWREVCQRLCRHILKQKERKKKREGSRREEENKHIWEGRYEYPAIQDVVPRVYINELISWFINNVFCVLVSPWVSLVKIWVAKS